MKIIKAEEFQAEVLNHSKPVLVDFFAEWCGPCKMLSPVLEKVSEKVADKASIVKIDIDQATDLAAQFGIMSVPTMIFFKNGEAVFKKVGLQQADALVQLIEENA